MMKKAFLVLVAATAINTPSRTFAQLESAALLTLECTQAATGSTSSSSAICMNYLIGVVEGANTGRRMFCVSRDTSATELASLYATFMQGHQQLVGENRITAAYAFLKKQMPCSARDKAKPRTESTKVDPSDSAQVLMRRCNPMGPSTTGCAHYLRGFLDGANIDRQMYCPRMTRVDLEGGYNGFKNGVEQIYVDGRIDKLPILFYAYARGHPQLLHRDAVDVVRAAFKESFSCERQ